jgi:hypothetical protein
MEISNLFQVIGREGMIKRALKGTAKLRELVEEKKTKDGLSEKGQKVRELCISLGPTGCAMAQLCSLLLDEKIEVKNTVEGMPHVKWAAFIPLQKYNNHNYEVGQMCFILLQSSEEGTMPVKQRALKEDGTFGNDIVLAKKRIEIPDDDHIVTAINKIFEELVKKGFSDAGIEV